MICPLTGRQHRPFWMRSAWWCQDCRQKLETCCEGDCPSSVGATAAQPGGRAGRGQAELSGAPVGVTAAP